MPEQYRFIITADDSAVNSSFNNIRRNGEDAANGVSLSFQTAADVVSAAWASKEIFGEIFGKITEFDDKAKIIEAFAGATSEQMDIVKAKATELAPVFGKTAAEVLDGMSAMKQGGMTLNETLQNIDKVLSMSAGTGLDMATSADKLTDIINMFGLTSRDSTDAVDVMVSAISNGALVADDYFESMKKAGPVLASYGLSLRDVSAEIMASAEGGIKGSIAATGLNNAYARLLKPTGDAVGILEKYNFTAVDGYGKTKKLADMIDELAEKGLTDKEKLQVFGMYAGPELSSLLARGGDSIRKYDELLSNVSGTGERVAITMQSGIGGAARKAGTAITNGIVKGLYELEPAIMATLGAVEKFDTVVDYTVGTIKTASAGVTAGAGAFAKLFSIIASGTDAIGVTTDASKQLADISDDAFGSAAELMDQASLSFSGLADSAVESAVKQNDALTSVGDRLKYINENTGLSLKTWQDLEDAVSSGALTWEEASAAAERHVDTTQRELSDLNASVEQQQKQQEEYASAIKAVYKSTGANAEEYFAIEEKRIQDQAKEYEEATQGRVNAEEWAAEAIKKLHSEVSDSSQKVIESFYKMTGAVDFKTEASEIEGMVDSWKQAGLDIEDINKGVYEKITEYIGKAMEAGSEENVAYLEEMRGKYDSFSGDLSESAQKINDELYGLNDSEATVEVSADISDAESGIDNAEEKTDEVDGSEAVVSVDADTSKFDSAMDGVESRANTTGTVNFDVSSISGLEEAIDELSQTPTLDPFGGIRENYEGDLAKMESMKSKYEDIISEMKSFGGDKDFTDEINKYQDALDKMNGVYDESKEEELKADRELEKAKKDIWKEELDARKENYKEQIDAQKETLEAQKDSLERQKDALNDSLDAAEDALDYAKERQKAYWEQQLDDAKEYYDQVKDEQDAAKEDFEAAAEAEYDAAVDLLEKKKKLWEDTLSAAEAHLKDLKQIYDESGEGADEYYKAEADALARRAQEMQDNGTDAALIEKWLTDELKDLRDKAAEAGVDGLEQYGEALISSYEKTGKFSYETAKANQQVASLEKQLAQLKDSGKDAFFDEAAYKALGFDKKLQSAQESIDSVQLSLDTVDGKNFDLAGESAESLANDVSSATEKVDSLKSSIESVTTSIDSMSTAIKNLGNIDIDKKFSNESYSSGSSSSSTSSSGKGKNGLTSGFMSGFFDAFSFDGGGYTGDSPRTGGLDGKGGFPAILHGNEVVIDLNNSKKSGIIGSGDGSINIGTINISTTQKIDGSFIKAELSRLKYRG
jgi:TP901 family phage tail tape measure protein